MRDARPLFPTLLAGLLVAAAIVLTALNASGALRSIAGPLTAPSLEVPHWRELDVGGHVVGNAASRVHVIVFSDYQCPACRALHDVLERLDPAIASQLSVRWRHFPLSMHAHARGAAAAAICAEKFGVLAGVHAALFRVSYADALPSWVAIARAHGVRDTLQYSECLTADDTMRALEADEADGRRLGLHGTPAILVGSALYGGLPTDLESILRVAARQDPPRR